MFSQQQAVVRVSRSFSSVRLAPPPTHDLQISPAGLSLLLLPKGEPSATLQQCSYGLVLELQQNSCREGKFSETHFVPLLILGNPICRGNSMRSGPGLCTNAPTSFRCM